MHRFFWIGVIILSEISQMVRDKYHDLTFNWNIINKTKKQTNITRDIEIKNNLTIAGGGGRGAVERRVFRNYYKGHMDKTKGEGGSKEGRWVWLGWGGEVGRKCRQL